MNDRNIEPNPILQTITQVGVSLMYEKFYRRRLVAPAGKGQLRPSEREASIVQFGEALGRLTGKKKTVSVLDEKRRKWIVKITNYSVSQSLTWLGVKVLAVINGTT